jgi:hypothetical protein
MNNDELIIELENKFNEWKKKAKFNVSFDELDDVFFLKDFILTSRFVSPKINRMICSRIRDTYNGWVQQIHSWLLPSPYSIISTSENQIFNEKEKEELNIILRELIAFISRNIINGLTKDIIMEGKFIDDSLIIWNKHLPNFIKYSNKIQEYWQSENIFDK